jgi:hypothetical protein
MIDELVGRDPEQPGPETAALPLERVEGTEGLLEGGGGDVLRYLPGAAAPVGEGVDAGQVEPVQLGEGVAVRARPLDERLLVEGRGHGQRLYQRHALD